MRFIPTRIHAFLDYGLGVIVAGFPYVAGFADRGLVERGCAVLGLGLLLYSFLTNYEYGAIRLIPLKVHLALDAVGGAALVALAIGAGSRGALLPLLILGLFEIGASLMTRTVASDDAGALAPSIGTSTRRAKVAMPLATGPSTADGRPDYPVDPRNVQTVEQLRGAIDSGRTHDKIAMTDPASVPLGSDDEAAELHDEEGLRVAREQAHR